MPLAMIVSVVAQVFSMASLLVQSALRCAKSIAITGMPFSDPTGGFKCFRREALEAIHFQTVASNGYSFQIELTHRVWRRGLSVSEVPIVFTDREQGTSKMSRGIAIEAAWMVWKLLLENGLRRHPFPANFEP